MIVENMKLNKAPRSIWTNPIHFTAFGFGSGASPVMPGTMGTLVGILFYLAISQYPLWLYLPLVIIGFAFGVWLCDKASKDVGVHDHPGIVWDEIIGYLVAMMAAPIGWGWVLFGFILFRVIDIWKPWPIRQCDHAVKGGLGIMLDDLIAGVFTLIVIQIIALFFRLLG